VSTGNVSPTPRASILVVDDDADARLMMRAALRKAGFEVRLAGGGEEAQAQFRAAPCDMVMLDVEMPDISGHELCAILREQAGPLLPIVMVTGSDDVQSVERAYQHGATDFIAKPVNWALLGHRVRYLLRGHQALLDLRDAQARSAAVLDAIPDLLFEVDLDGRYLDYRAPRGDLLAAPGDTLIGRTMSEVLPAPAAEICLRALRTALAEGSSVGEQLQLRVAAGGTRWFELSVSRKAVAAGQKPRFIVLSRDITERKEAEARIARLAYYDSLTGLPNRRSFLERIEREIRRAAHRPGRFAILFMDLDGFKNINDTMGHQAGDVVLQAAAERLHAGLRPSDVLSRPIGLDEEPSGEVEVARLGGDEFTALLCDLDDPQEAVAVAQRICTLMRRPFRLDDRDVTLTASVGIALYPEDGRDAATLLTHADTAMYHAKTSGRDNAKVYSVALTDRLVRRMELDASLRMALEREELHLEYQPQVDRDGARVLKVEALLRWTHPTRGPVPPLEFIPLAEENGLIDAIGLWVLRTACADAARWNRDGLRVGIAVNLSPLQFADPELASRVLEVAAQAGLPAELLELEVTEGALMDNSAPTRATLQHLRQHGVAIALDDFGTGYSSLAYLTRMPISHIKVDRAFVAGLPGDRESEAIVRAVLAMAHSLGLRVTAEGVENAAQAAVLRGMGCDSLQGYHFGRPMRAQAIPALLRDGRAVAKTAKVSGSLLAS
jgi:PAS domain S-box-containing protein